MKERTEGGGWGEGSPSPREMIRQESREPGTIDQQHGFRLWQFPESVDIPNVQLCFPTSSGEVSS